MEFTFDKEIALDSLQKIKAMLDLVTERASVVETPNDFLCSPGGMLRLDAICMNLIALGETVKGLDKLTDGQLLKNYPDVYWKGVMGMRDKISHHYFEIDTDVVFRTLEEDIPAMNDQAYHHHPPLLCHPYWTGTGVEVNRAFA